MRFTEQELPGVFIIEAELFVDARGIFRRNFCKTEYAAHNIISEIRQCNISENRYKYTLRGFHYQVEPYSEAKTISCLKGAIYDIVVDLRPGSATYLKWISLEIDDKNRKTIYVPPGCAHAFLTMRDETMVFYYCSEVYTPAAERGIRYNDPFFRFQWPAQPRIISDKDKTHPDFSV